MLDRIPKPNFWRPMTENDNAALLPFRAGDWKLASMYVTHKSHHGRKAAEPEFDPEEVRVTYTHNLPTSWLCSAPSPIKCTVTAPST